MARRPYRVELKYSSRGNAAYYLVRDVKVGTHKTKVRKYISVREPTKEEVERLRRSAAAEMEVRTALKKAEYHAREYRSKYLDPAQVLQVERIRGLYEGVLQALTPSEVDAYERDFEVSYIQGTTSIEGNTLSPRQAADLLLHGITPRGKALREINEIQNFKQVVRYRNSYKRKVTPDFVKHLHALIMQNIDIESAGNFRRVDDVQIAGCDLKVTPAAFVGEELEAAIDGYYRDLQSGLHPFELAVTFHYEFEMIHPFSDGNGRVGREILNYMLTRTKCPRLLFLGKTRPLYIAALKRGNRENYRGMVGDFVDLIVSQRLKILERRLRDVAAPSRKTGQLRLTDFVSSEPRERSGGTSSGTTPMFESLGLPSEGDAVTGSRGESESA